MTSDSLQQVSTIEFRLARRLRRELKTTVLDALIVCAPNEATGWRRLGNIAFLVPGLDAQQGLDADGVPLVIDEASLRGGVWAGIDCSTGEDRLAELEQVADRVRNAGGITIGVIRAGSIPDVNLARLRTLYDIKISNEEPMIELIEPYLVQRMRTILREEWKPGHE